MMMYFEPASKNVKSKGDQMITKIQFEPKKVTFAPEVKILGPPEITKQDFMTPKQAQESIDEEKPSNDDTDASCRSVSEQMEDDASADDQETTSSQPALKREFSFGKVKPKVDSSFNQTKMKKSITKAKSTKKQNGEIM
jgi:hypothetical protein